MHRASVGRGGPEGPRHAVLDLEARLDDVEGLEGEGGGEARDAAGDGVGPVKFFFPKVLRLGLVSSILIVKTTQERSNAR